MDIKEHVVIDTYSAHLHQFAKLPGHPVGKDGRARCPNCMVIGIDFRDQEIKAVTKELTEIKQLLYTRG